MNVQELINELQMVQNKKQKVYIHSDVYPWVITGIKKRIRNKMSEPWVTIEKKKAKFSNDILPENTRLIYNDIIKPQVCDKCKRNINF